jgi:hypothetical protein
VILHRFSPTGFYSSAVHNEFLLELQARSDRQIAYTPNMVGDHSRPLDINRKGNIVYVTQGDLIRANKWIHQGFTSIMRTPDQTLIFVVPEKQAQIRQHQIECMGCLSQCRFSNWATNEKNSTGRKADPRSFCIQKTLQDIAHGGDLEHNLMFSGHNCFNFARDPFYSNGFIPTVKELFERILTGD